MNRIQLINYIESNQDIFQHNGILSETKLRRMFSIEKPSLTGSFGIVTKRVNAYTLKRAKAYSTINTILRDRGLVIKQETNEIGTVKFRILNEVETMGKIRSYRKQANMKRNAARALNSGYVYNKKVGYFQKPIPGIED